MIRNKTCYAAPNSLVISSTFIRPSHKTMRTTYDMKYKMPPQYFILLVHLIQAILYFKMNGCLEKKL